MNNLNAISTKMSIFFICLAIFLFTSSIAANAAIGYVPVQGVSAYKIYPTPGNWWSYTGNTNSVVYDINGVAPSYQYVRQLAGYPGMSLPIQNVYSCRVHILNNYGSSIPIGPTPELNWGNSFQYHYLEPNVAGFDVYLTVSGGMPFQINDITYGLSARQPLSWVLECEICQPSQFLENTHCCSSGATFTTGGDSCCYNGAVYPSDSIITADPKFVCFEGQLYTYLSPAPPGPFQSAAKCQLRSGGSKYYFNNQNEGWLAEGDSSEALCTMCNPQSARLFNWDMAGKCCGDDGKDDDGSVILENTIACYNGDWIDSTAAGVPFKIYTAKDAQNNTDFEYDIISNSERWHICDANGLVPEMKSGKQTANGGYLEVPRDVTFTLQSSAPQEAEEQGELDFEEMSANIGSPVSLAGQQDTAQTMTMSYADVSARFVCAKEDADNKFLECCPAPEQCINKDNGKYRLPGSFLSTIEEFTPECTKQYCPYTWGMKASNPDYNYFLPIFLDGKKRALSGTFLADANINDWSGYDYLEFYVYAVDDLSLQLYIGGAQNIGSAGNSGSDYSQLFLKNILTPAYVANGIGLKKWMHVRVPVSELSAKTGINVIEFREPKQSAMGEGQLFSVSGTNYYNIIALDKIHLVKADTERVCSGAEYDANTLPNLWVDDMDKDEAACESVPGYGWSGSRCCGDDAHEYYQDGSSYCWNGNLLAPGTAIADTEGSGAEDADLLYALDRAFYSCSQRMDVTHGELSIVSTPVSTNCYIKDAHVCSPNQKWSKELFGLSSIDARDTPKPTFDSSEQSCCPNDYCWNSRRCIKAASGITNSSSLELFAGGAYGDPVLFACLLDTEGAGIWQQAYKSVRWDGISEAYCPDQTTCWNGETCTFEGAYAEDHYCRQGTWSTRTKLLATKMLGIANTASPDDFTLYCDRFENTLPYPGYEPLNTFLNDDGANNFCVLKYGEKLIVGTALNKDKLDGFLNIAAMRSCQFPAEISDNYNSCNSNDQRLWYNNQYNTVIYSKDAFDITGASTSIIPASFDEAVQLILDVIRPITRLFTGEVRVYNGAYLKPIREFNTLYIAKSGSKEVLGVIEEIDPAHAYLSVEYKNFNTDICRNVAHPSAFCQPVIDTSISSDYVDFHLFSFSKDKFDEIWQPATSMLRYQSRLFAGFRPDATIASPLPGAYAQTGNLELGAGDPQEDVRYYWDLESGSIVNGELKGASLSQKVSAWYKGVGNKKLTMIAITKGGRYATASVDITIN